MAYKISSDCNACGACEAECPNSAITLGGEIYEIAANKCSECVGFHKEPQCAAVCPIEACQPDPAHAETEAALIAKVKGLHPGKTFPNPMPSRFAK